ncbi:hypothetical protein [Leucobacter sp. 1207-22]|uniref:hypothetical protein n=1 Tax=Leucobacter sp. 1207-22 TaxID=2604456 RepID=UPI004063F9E5
MNTQHDPGALGHAEAVERCAEQLTAVEALPLAERAPGFERMYTELVSELERSDVSAE